LWTGDNIAHDVWMQYDSNQTRSTEVLTKVISETLGDVQIYPIYGNHECFPADEFNFTDNGNNTIKLKTSDIWKKTIP